MTAAQFRPPPPPPPKKLTSCHAAILAIMTTWALAGRDCRTVNVIVCHWLCPIVSGKCSVGLKVVGRHRFIESVSEESSDFDGWVQTSAHAAAEG